MSVKLFSCLVVLVLASTACKGYSKSYLRNPLFRALYYRHLAHGGLSNSNPVPVTIPTADTLVQNEEEVRDYENDEGDYTVDRIPGQENGLPEDIDSFIPGAEKIKNDLNDLRPILYSMRGQLSQLVRSRTQSEVTNRKVLSVLVDTLAWAKIQASMFYSLITTFKSR